MLKKPLTIDAAIERAEAMCARAEYSQAEVFKKLTSWGIDRRKAEEIVDELAESGFIDDRRLAQAFVNDKVEIARWGRRKIYVSLYQKGISRELIEEALGSINERTYRLNIEELIKIKGRNIESPGSFEGKNKILRFMMSRGFESGLVIKCLNNPRIWDEED